MTCTIRYITDLQITMSSAISLFIHAIYYKSYLIPELATSLLGMVLQQERGDDLVHLTRNIIILDAPQSRIHIKRLFYGQLIQKGIKLRTVTQPPLYLHRGSKGFKMADIYLMTDMHFIELDYHWSQTISSNFHCHPNKWWIYHISNLYCFVIGKIFKKNPYICHSYWHRSVLHMNSWRHFSNMT